MPLCVTIFILDSAEEEAHLVQQEVHLLLQEEAYLAHLLVQEEAHFAHLQLQEPISPIYVVLQEAHLTHLLLQEAHLTHPLLQEAHLANLLLQEVAHLAHLLNDDPPPPLCSYCSWFQRGEGKVPTDPCFQGSQLSSKGSGNFPTLIPCPVKFPTTHIDKAENPLTGLAPLGPL